MTSLSRAIDLTSKALNETHNTEARKLIEKAEQLLIEAEQLTEPA